MSWKSRPRWALHGIGAYTRVGLFPHCAGAAGTSVGDPGASHAVELGFLLAYIHRLCRRFWSAGARGPADSARAPVAAAVAAAPGLRQPTGAPGDLVGEQRIRGRGPAWGYFINPLVSRGAGRWWPARQGRYVVCSGSRWASPVLATCWMFDRQSVRPPAVDQLSSPAFLVPGGSGGLVRKRMPARRRVPALTVETGPAGRGAAPGLPGVVAALSAVLVRDGPANLGHAHDRTGIATTKAASGGGCRRPSAASLCSVSAATLTGTSEFTIGVTYFWRTHADLSVDSGPALVWLAPGGRSPSTSVPELPSQSG